MASDNFEGSSTQHSAPPLTPPIQSPRVSPCLSTQTLQLQAPPTNIHLQRMLAALLLQKVLMKYSVRTRGPFLRKHDTEFCINIWVEWSKHREELTGTRIIPLEMTVAKMQYRLYQFIGEVREMVLSTHQTLHHIVCGIMRRPMERTARHQLLQGPPVCQL